MNTTETDEEIDMNFVITILTLISSVLTFLSNMWQSSNNGDFESTCTVGKSKDSVKELVEAIKEMSEDV